MLRQWRTHPQGHVIGRVHVTRRPNPLTALRVWSIG